MSVTKGLSEMREILLVDDIVTQGSTLLGAANRLKHAFPQANIRAFAAMRAVFPDMFQALVSPYLGTVDVTPAGRARRTP